MKTYHRILAVLLLVSASATIVSAQSTENATLNATVTAGALEIVPASVNGPWNPTSGAITVSGSAQNNAVTFAIDGITINDLNGDGQGWNLTATPGNLTNGGSTMTVGTTAGFNTPSDAANTDIVGANDVDYTLLTGVAGYTINYDIAYNVPAWAAAGAYSGTIVFALVAQ